VTKPERERVAVTALNADVVGYSRLMADDRDATSDAMAAARRTVDAAVLEHGGRLVNFVGDNFMAVFDEPMPAVRAAIAITTALEQANADLPPARRLRFRMGIETGEALITQDDYQGDVLNVAARIQALAPTGGLSVSGAVYRSLDEPALRFRSAGTRRLKNIPEPVEVYQFADLPTGGDAEVPTELALAFPCVAVLPLHAESLAGEIAAVSPVVREDLLHRLAAIPELEVLDAGNAEPGAKARYMLESGVYQLGSRVRVHATLFDVTTMNVVKAHKETGAVEELLELSETLADRVGRTVEVELVTGVPAGFYAELGDAASIQKIYMGWYHLRSSTAEGWQQARTLLGEVADAHPDMPYGWVLAAFANWMGASQGWAADPERVLELARSQAERGRQVGDPTGLGQAVVAAVQMSTGQIAEAVQTVAGLEITRPTCDVTYGLEGSLKRYLGQWEEAIGLMDRAMRLTAVNKPWYPTVKASSLLIGTRPEQAAATAESVLEFQPANVEALLVLAAAQVELGLRRRAQATAATIREQFPSLQVSDWLAHQPYQDPELVDRWRADLAELDLVEAG
jgi:adenylate cyclase